jgi:hypothetical protein
MNFCFLGPEWKLKTDKELAVRVRIYKEGNCPAEAVLEMIEELTRSVSVFN